VRVRFWLTFVLISSMIGSSLASTYIFEKSNVKGVGYRDSSLMGQTVAGFEGQKFSESIMGSGRFDDRTEFEVDSLNNTINYTKNAEFEYFPISYQTGVYDRKWSDMVCAINYDAGAVFTEAYTHAESLMRSSEIRTWGNFTNASLQANIDSKITGVARIGWISRQRTERRFVEIGRSVEELTGTFAVRKMIQLGNGSASGTRVDWMPCL